MDCKVIVTSFLASKYSVIDAHECSISMVFSYNIPTEKQMFDRCDNVHKG